MILKLNSFFNCNDISKKDISIKETKTKGYTPHINETTLKVLTKWISNVLLINILKRGINAKDKQIPIKELIKDKSKLLPW